MVQGLAVSYLGIRKPGFGNGELLLRMEERRLGIHARVRSHNNAGPYRRGSAEAVKQDVAGDVASGWFVNLGFLIPNG